MPLYPRSSALLTRAEQIIPGAYHLSGRPLTDPEHSPMYMERAQGCRIWDADGNMYVDYLMAFGPFLLGYAHPEVDAAAIARIKEGHLLSMNHRLHLTFIEALLARFAGADMGLFLRTGSEATSTAIRIARRATGRTMIARCGYHGWHDWCLPTENFVAAGLREQVHEFAPTPEALTQVLERHPGQFAAVILAPEMIIPTAAEPLQRIQALAKKAGAVFILDEVKTAFRIAPGSIQARVGIVPDITTLSKALGNGWPIAAVIGTREVMQAGAGLHHSATFHGDTAAMAAALKTLDILQSTDVTGHVWRMGEMLITGLNAIAARHRVAARAYGEPLPPMPFLRFEDANVARAFYNHLYAHGVLFHPRHMWFISLAHREEDIASTLEKCDAAMAAAIS